MNIYSWNMNISDRNKNILKKIKSNILTQIILNR